MKRYSSTLSLTWALQVVNVRPGPLYPRERDPFYVRLSETQVRSGLERKISRPSEFDPGTVLPVAGCYTDRSIQTRSVNNVHNTVRQDSTATIQGLYRYPKSHTTQTVNSHESYVCRRFLYFRICVYAR